ncbi:MAG: GldG family protein [Verrucomicrobiae bacterium]|nr:GldG family protein [Verrucomicrobiae bacterium]
MDHGTAPKRVVVASNVIIQVILVGVILVFANLAFYRWHPKKADLSSSQYYKLSEKSLQLLKSLKEPVNVVVFFQPMAEDPVAQKVFVDVQNLLNEYKEASKQLKIEYVDPDRDQIKAEKLATEYGVKVLNVVVFAQGKRSKYVQVNDLVDYERGNPWGGGGGKIKAFKGEQQFTSAIQNVVEEKQQKVYFVQGHGEGDIDSTDKKGFSTMTKYIRRDNLIVEKLSIFEKQQIPKDCDILVVCGPSKAFSEVELKCLQDYLGQNGRLMVMLDAMRADTGLEKLLADYGLKVGNDLVLCEFIHLMEGKKVNPIAPGGKYASHPITSDLSKGNVEVMLPMARSIDKADGADSGKQRVTLLVQTPAEAWGETELQKLRSGEKVQCDEKDRKGPVPVAAAVEPSAAGDMEREGMRMVVFGSSSFIDNQYCGASGNMDLFLNSVNWLLKRQQLIGIAPKAPKEFSLVLSPFQLRAIGSTEILLIPLLVAVAGFVVWLNRRR